MADTASQQPFDVVVLGGDVDGLVAATYLARAGRRVLVVDSADALGGTAVTDEIMPGVRAPALWPSVETLSGVVVTELDLGGHGLDIGPPQGVFVATGDERGRFIAPPGESEIDTRRLRQLADAGVGDEDIAAFELFDGFMHRLGAALAPVLECPLPHLDATSIGNIAAVLRPLIALRRLGREELAEVMRFLPMPLHDVVEERFADEALRIAVAAGGLVASWLGPRSPGGALNLALHRCGIGRGALSHPRFARGGPGALAAALEAAARAAGVEIRTGAQIGEIATERRQGGIDARGLVVDGELVSVRAIVSTRDPRTTLLDQVGARLLPPSLVRKLVALRSRGTVGIVTFVLDSLPSFVGADDDDRVLAGRIHVAASLDDIERAFDDTKYGRIPGRPYLEVTLPTLTDPSLAPADVHVLHAWVQYPPAALRDGSWDEAREALGDVVQSTLVDAAPGFGDRVRLRRVTTPADLADRFGLPGGSPYHLEPALDQSLFLRPLPGWSRHASPVHGLYFAGPATHGGYGLSALSGRNAASVVADDLRVSRI